jgi:hypothetical protein
MVEARFIGEPVECPECGNPHGGMIREEEGHVNFVCNKCGYMEREEDFKPVVKKAACATMNCEDKCDKKDWSYCGQGNCSSCGGGCGDDNCSKCNRRPKWGSKKASTDRAFSAGWSVVKSKSPRSCPMCLSEELEIDTKEDNLQEIAEKGGRFQGMSDQELKREREKTKQGPNYWGYCLNCDEDMEG